MVTTSPGDADSVARGLNFPAWRSAQADGGDGPCDRLSRLARELMDAEAALVALVGDDRHVIVGQVGTVPDLEPILRLSLDRSFRGQISVAERANPETTWDTVYSGVPLEISGSVVVALVGVLRPRLRTWSGQQQARLDELAMLTVAIIEDQVRAGVAQRLEELIGRIVLPLGDLAGAVRRMTDLIETPPDPRLPRMADVVRRRLAAVEEVAHELDAMAAHARPVDGARPALDLRETVRRAVGRSAPSGRADQVLVDLPVDPVWVCLLPGPAERALSGIFAAAVHHAATDGTVRISLTEVDGRAAVFVTSPGHSMPLPDLLRVVGDAEVLDPEGAAVSVSLTEDGARVHRQGLDVLTGASGTLFTIHLAVEVHPPGRRHPGGGHRGVGHEREREERDEAEAQDGLGGQVASSHLSAPRPSR